MVTVSVGAPRSVRGVHITNQLTTRILRVVRPCIGPNIDANRLSHVYGSCVIGRRRTISTYLNCRNCPGSIYVSVGRIIYRNVPSSTGLLGSNSVIGVSIAMVGSNFRNSASGVFVINGPAVVNRHLYHVARRDLCLTLHVIGPNVGLHRVNTTVRGFIRTRNFSIIHRCYKRNVNHNFRRRPRILRCSSHRAGIMLGPKVAFAVRPVIGTNGGRVHAVGSN